ncbi:hypothetical protein [Campylobacter sp.]|nr:hypothetical protein [Campylobacter sp.]MCI6564515.1 hypothetical protein [Campylobacter sp.]MDD7090929.1 hypothetical protein [Campylobacteraceae bacterium]MDY3245851.1 hypothetical protein [Campylobacter sp.]MDY4013639.1 hypothetical protein [Campylobacter sp.]
MSKKIANKTHDILKSLSGTIPQEISPEASAFLNMSDIKEALVLSEV